MTQTLPRLIVLAALVLEGAVPARAAPPKNPPLPPARPAFPDDPPIPADPNAAQAGAEGVSAGRPLLENAADLASRLSGGDHAAWEERRASVRAARPCSARSRTSIGATVQRRRADSLTRLGGNRPAG